MLSDSEKAVVTALYVNGISGRSIADQIGRSKNVVYEYRRRVFPSSMTETNSLAEVTSSLPPLPVSVVATANVNPPVPNINPPTIVPFGNAHHFFVSQVIMLAIAFLL